MSAAEIVIDVMIPEDWKVVQAIYQEGINTGNATFEIQAPEWEAWDKSHLQECRLVAKHSGKVVGWTALSRVSSRCVYAGVAEHSIYIAEAARGHGIGKRLLSQLVAESEKAGFWTLQSGVFLENRASLALHKLCGFREIGRRERIGKMNGIWRDTILIERRSTIVGID